MNHSRRSLLSALGVALPFGLGARAGASRPADRPRRSGSARSRRPCARPSRTRRPVDDAAVAPCRRVEVGHSERSGPGSRAATTTARSPASPPATCGSSGPGPSRGPAGGRPALRLHGRRRPDRRPDPRRPEPAAFPRSAWECRLRRSASSAPTKAQEWVEAATASARRLPHFLTCTVVGWLPVYTRPETVQIVLDSWEFLQEKDRMSLLGYVILENHLHLIASAEDLRRRSATSSLSLHGE